MAKQYLAKQEYALKRDELLLAHKDCPEEQDKLQDFFDHKEEYKKDFQEFKSATEKSLQEAYDQFDRLQDEYIKYNDQFYDYVLNSFEKIIEIGDEVSIFSYDSLKSTHKEYKEYLSLYVDQLIKQGKAIKERLDYYALSKWNGSKYEVEFDKKEQQLLNNFAVAKQHLENSYENPDPLPLGELLESWKSDLLPEPRTRKSKH